MQFNLPTTKAKMYEILNDLFNYYRIQRPSYELEEQKGLNLEKMQYISKTEQQLRNMAEIILASQDEREVLALKKEISAEKSKLEQKLIVVQNNYLSAVENASALYSASIEKVKSQATVNELINSSVYLDKLSLLEGQKNQKLIELASARDNEIATINSSIAMLNTKLSECEDYYSSVHEKQVLAKIEELREKESEKKDEVFKYNNSIEEKIQRYENTIIRSNASLQLKFLEIKVQEFTKDQLVEMGYYDDVIRCVCGYYDTLSALSAFQDMKAEIKLAIYLEDYYSNIIYMYGVRAGVN